MCVYMYLHVTLRLVPLSNLSNLPRSFLFKVVREPHAKYICCMNKKGRNNTKTLGVFPYLSFFFFFLLSLSLSFSPSAVSSPVRFSLALLSTVISRVQVVWTCSM